MMKFILKYLPLFLLFGCVSTKNSDKNIEIQKENFITYKHNNNTLMKTDNEIVTDRYYSIKIPKKLKKVKERVSYFFSNVFEFDKKQKIFTLYVPDKKYNLEDNRKIYSYDDFVKKTNELKVFNMLDNIKLQKNRNFRILLLDDNFFIMYINIDTENIEEYNYFVDSVIFLN